MLVACDSSRVYEENIDFTQQEWNSTDTLDFVFHINELTAKNAIINFRHQTDFNWRNVWLEYAIKYPNDSIFSSPINIQLSQPNGQWFGDCSSGKCMVQFPLPNYQNYTFPDTGTYHLRLVQLMREDPLLYSMSAGLRIENYSPEE